mgnify:CR=1 FL=1
MPMAETHKEQAQMIILEVQGSKEDESGCCNSVLLYFRDIIMVMNIVTLGELIFH